MELANAAIHGGQGCSFTSLHQYTPLHLAADGGRTDTAKFLVDKGAYTNIRDNNHDVSE